jgi:uncharacterized protein involved in exopolysaccharide biosynthesis
MAGLQSIGFTITPADLVWALRRRPWLVVALTLVFGAIGVGVSFTLKPTYTSTAVVFADRGKYPTSIASKASTTVPSLDAHLGDLLKRTFVRDNFAALVDRFNLYPNLKRKVIEEGAPTREELQRRVQITLTDHFAEHVTRKIAGGQDKKFVELAFTHADPHVAAEVANALVDVLKTENSALRKRYATDVLDYVQETYNKARRVYDDVDVRRNEFRRQNARSLPEHESVLSNQIARLRMDETNFQRSIEAAEIRLQQARTELRSLYAEIARQPAAPVHTESRLTELRAQLAAARAELWDVRERYTDAHPKVAAARRTVEDLETQERTAQDMMRASLGRGGGEAAPIETVASGNDEDYADALLKYAYRSGGDTGQTRRIVVTVGDFRQAVSAVAAERKRIAALTAEAGDAMHAQARLPMVRRELEVIEQEYQDARKVFLEANQELENARKVHGIEMSDRGEQFSVVEPAVAPVAPQGTARMVVVGAGVVVGLGLGVALALLLGLLERTFHHSGQVQDTLGIVVLVEVPTVPGAEKRKAVAG